MSTNILKSVILFGSKNIYRTNHSFTGTSPSILFRRTAGKRPVVLVLSRGFVFIVAYMVLHERVVRQRTVELGQPLPFHPEVSPCDSSLLETDSVESTEDNISSLSDIIFDFKTN